MLETVADESRHVLPDMHRFLPDRGKQRHGRRDQRRVRAFGLHHLDQPHRIGRIPEMRPHHALGPANRRRHARDRDHRGVGRQNDLRPARLVQFAKDPLLQLDLLGCRLDHQNAACDLRRDTRMQPDALDRLGRLPAARCDFAQARRRIATDLVDGINEMDHKRTAGEDLGDADAHAAGTDDGNRTVSQRCSRHRHTSPVPCRSLKPEKADRGPCRPDPPLRRGVRAVCATVNVSWSLARVHHRRTSRR
jgi:hypothetical protein